MSIIERVGFRIGYWIEKILLLDFLNSFLCGENGKPQSAKIRSLYWQNRVGNRLTEELWAKIKDWGFANQFDVFTKPDATPFQVSIFLLDPLAPSILGGHRHGFEVFRVEIRYPNFFGMTIFENGENPRRSCYCKTEEQILKEAKEILFYVISQLVYERPAR